MLVRRSVGLGQHLSNQSHGRQWHGSLGEAQRRPHRLGRPRRRRREDDWLGKSSSQPHQTWFDDSIEYNPIKSALIISIKPHFAKLNLLSVDTPTDWSLQVIFKRALMQVQSLCKMAGETKTSLSPPRATPAGRMRRREAACGTAPAPREAARPGDREATAAGDRATLPRSPATRWRTNTCTRSVPQRPSH